MKKENRADYGDGLTEAVIAVEKAFSALMRDPSEKYLKEATELEIILNRLKDLDEKHTELLKTKPWLNHGHFLG